MGILAAFTRFFHLSHPKELIFDETYYVKDAYSLLHHGFEAAWGEDVNNAFISGDFSGLDVSQAAYVVHPPLGKWILALGQGIFGSDSALGWRFSAALVGVLSVMLVVRIALRLFRSPLLAGVAGFAMALDGMGIVLSRTGLLDNILAFFVLLGFWAVLLDREHSRARLAHSVAHGFLTRDGGTHDTWGPSLFFRPWLLVAAAFLGCAMGVKWSGIYAVAVFGILVFIWGVTARKAVGAPLYIGAGVWREGFPAFIQLVPLAFITYIGSWASWFANPHGWDRTWAQNVDSSELPLSWAPDTVNSFLHYHSAMWDFHHGLNTPHTYQSQAWAWLVQARPVSFYWKGTEDMASACPNSQCVQAITSIGNIAVWWLGVLALAALIVLGIQRNDWRAGAIGSGYVAVWLPWFAYSNRTIFQFYAIALLPFVVLALGWAIGAVTNALGQPYVVKKSSLSELFEGMTGTWHSGVMTAYGYDWHARFSDFPHVEAELSEAIVDDTVSLSDEEEVDGKDFAQSKSDHKPECEAEWWAEKHNRYEYALSGLSVTLIGIVAILWYPLWIGSTISYKYWYLHMLFPSLI